MADKNNILDGLAWAGITEEARVARVSSDLVSKLNHYTKTHTRTAIKEAVRATAPPYGRGKYITEAVEVEYLRQAPIHLERRRKHDEWKKWLDNEALISTRLNRAYAGTFRRPMYSDRNTTPEGYYDWDYSKRRDWDKAERERDKGDNCIGIAHQGDYVVALLSSRDSKDGNYIATRRRGEDEITYTKIEGYDRWESPRNLAEAALMLGGPKVRHAIARGKRVKTDWVARRSFIHHDGSDHEEPKVEEVAWVTSENE